MPHSRRNTIKLKFISRFYICATLLTFILWGASIHYTENVFTDTNRPYQYPFEVSKALSKIQFNIFLIHKVMEDIEATKSAKDIKRVSLLVAHYESKLLSDFISISEHSLGNKDAVNKVHQLMNNWRKSRQRIFDLHAQRANADQLKHAQQKNNDRVSELQSKLTDIAKLSNGTTHELTDISITNLNKIEEIGLAFILFLLVTQLLLFITFKNNSIREKNKVLKALDWANELLNSSPDAMIITDKKGNIQQINITAEKLFGYSKAEFITLNISQLIPKRFINHQEKINSFFDKSSTRQMGEGRDLFAVNKSGVEFQVEISLNIAELNNNKVAITSIRDVTKQKQIESKVLHQASYDFLTQLPNRFLSLDRLSTSIEHAKRKNNKLAVMYMDLDDFKRANDLFGHQMGDKVLVATAKKLKETMRSEDTVGRLGGDEFFILVDNFDSEQSLIKIANNILCAFEKPFSINKQDIVLSASIGISIYPDDGNTVEDLLVNADLSMYRAKKNGKNSFTFFENSMRDTLNRKSSIEEALKGGLERDEFYLVYQPKYQISSNTIIGFEALLRWENAEFKDIGPDEFIPLIEQIGLINDVGMFVLENALQEVKNWQDITQQPLHMAVNISPLHFNDPTLFQSIIQTLTKYDLSGQSLEIEITEGVLLEGTRELKETLNELKKANISIALDDFGTGYSSLSYIKDYPINSIKIDRSFIEQISKNKTHAALVKAIISLAHSLDCTVTAEGIEDHAQLEFLRKHKCDIAQGYYLSRPIKKSKIPTLL